MEDEEWHGDLFMSSLVYGIYQAVIKIKICLKGRGGAGYIPSSSSVSER